MYKKNLITCKMVYNVKKTVFTKCTDFCVSDKACTAVSSDRM